METYDLLCQRPCFLGFKFMHSVLVCG